MDEDAKAPDLGYIGRYGVLIVPPEEDTGQWFVSLASWDDGAEAYGAGTDGPLTDTREEALDQADRVLNWLATQQGQGDLSRVWEQMQDQLGAQGLDRKWPPERGPWGGIIR